MVFVLIFPVLLFIGIMFGIASCTLGTFSDAELPQPFLTLTVHISGVQCTLMESNLPFSVLSTLLSQSVGNLSWILTHPYRTSGRLLSF